MLNTRSFTSRATRPDLKSHTRVATCSIISLKLQSFTRGPLSAKVRNPVHAYTAMTRANGLQLRPTSPSRATVLEHLWMDEDLCNGIRHMWWDIGWGFKPIQVTQSGYLVLAVTVVLTGILLVTT